MTRKKTFDEAEAYTTRSRELAAVDDLASQAAWRMAQAQILSSRRELDAALTLSDEAIGINGSTEYLNWQGGGYEVRGTSCSAPDACLRRERRSAKRSTCTSGSEPSRGLSACRHISTHWRHDFRALEMMIRVSSDVCGTGPRWTRRFVYLAGSRKLPVRPAATAQRTCAA